MSSGDEARYALSFISYARPGRRDRFLQFAKVLANTMAALFDARPHWGKVCPLPPSELARLYPGLREFVSIQKHIDPADAFANEWVCGILAAARS
jgi:xylitol oxidase